MLNTHLFSNVLLPISLALIMFSMGLSLTFRDFAKIFRYPKALLFGLGAQMIFLPIIAFLLMWLAPLDPIIKIGLILVAICPGGATSNMLNYLLKGNLALVVSLTTVNSFLTQLTIPGLLGLAFYLFTHEASIAAEVTLDFWSMLLKIFTITLLPTLIGVLLRLKFPRFAIKSQPYLKVIMPSFLAIAMIGSVFFERNTANPSIDWYTYLEVTPWLLTLHGLSMVGSYLLSRKYMKLNIPTSMSIGMEVGLQNTALALTIALAVLNVPALAIPASIYALFSFFTTALFGVIVSGNKLSIKDILGF